MSIGNFNTNNITKQTSIAMWLSWGFMVLLLVWCFIIPPRGENAEEILKACILLYLIIPSAIAREAIKEGRSTKLKHGETELTIGEDND